MAAAGTKFASNTYIDGLFDDNPNVSGDTRVRRSVCRR